MENKAQYTETEIYTLRTLKTPGTGRVLARWLMGLSAVFIILLFLPWQQNIRGTGKITAFTPANRPQSVESAIAGRIANWNIREGQFVNEGDTILTLSEIKDKYFDPDLLLRMREQLEAKEQSISSKTSKSEALRSQIRALNQAKNVKYKQAQNKLKQTRLKLTSDSVDFLAQEVRFQNFKNQYERNKKLYEAGNTTLTKFQDKESKYQEARMKIVSSENKYLQTKAEVINAEVNLAGVQAEYQDKINKAESNLNATLADMFDSQASLSKLRNEYSNMQIRNEQYQVLAPQSGYLVKAMRAGIGETIKEGEAVATIMPADPDIAVEMYVQAMDVPLISIGRKVRIEFDGWPALQFSGWPSVSVGTFGGVVQVIDFVQSKQGKFRILVTPDPDDDPWPALLRFGSGTNGWVMLDSVPLWFELWRQLNGFPPSLYMEPDEEKEKKSKSQVAPKLKVK
ncbi:HlyD family secretion protein [Reichenbachiella versicolor]|uniref:HlyD family secretion protein n=1 Tax=Reichenbachiella versicolor TaxID=1821036 RepID=UPI000D6DDF1E|nr:HlyD family efflux transporter periplasmic adaptor subunit [Reichenbachiella versicolor]